MNRIQQKKVNFYKKIYSKSLSSEDIDREINYFNYLETSGKKDKGFYKDQIEALLSLRFCN